MGKGGGESIREMPQNMLFYCDATRRIPLVALAIVSPLCVYVFTTQKPRQL